MIKQSEAEDGIDGETASELKTDSTGPMTSTSSWPGLQLSKTLLSAAAPVFVPSVSAPAFKPSFAPSAPVFTPSAPAPAQPAKISYVGIVKGVTAEATNALVPHQVQPGFVPAVQIPQATKRAPPGLTSPPPAPQRLEFKPAPLLVLKTTVSLKAEPDSTEDLPVDTSKLP